VSIVFCDGDKSISFRCEHDSWPTELLLSPPFHPHSGVSVSSLGASWVFSIQPVLPPVMATFHSTLQRECWARAMTQSPELGL
jgi:hypothetical protein